MSKKKIIVLAIVLAFVLIIGGMLAYFTDTDTKENVFTFGDEVNISLTEQWNAADGLGLHPGAVVTKAPKIVNNSTTTSAYVFAEVIVPCYASTGTTANTPLFTLNSIGEGWTKISTGETVNSDNKTITYVYAWGNSSAMTELNAEATTTTPVFGSVTLAPTLTKQQQLTANEATNIIVNAYGIQIDNLGTTSPIEIYNLAKPIA